MKISSPTAVCLLLLSSLPESCQAVKRGIQRSLRFSYTTGEQGSETGSGKTGKGKGKSDTSTGKTGKGKGKSGDGKNGKGKSGSSSQCVCNGIIEFTFVDPITLFELALQRLSNIAGAEFGDPNPFEFVVPLTYPLAHSLAPPNCQLASVDSENDILRLQGLMAGSGWVGVTKDLAQAYEDQMSDDIEVRRDGWFNIDGSTVDPMGWADGQPGQNLDTSTTMTEYVAYLTSDGLVSTTLQGLPSPELGAYYECCAEVLPECFESGWKSLEDVLLPVLEASGSGAPGPGAPEPGAPEPAFT